MKTKCLLFTALPILLCVSCKKQDCIKERFSNESGNIILNENGFNDASVVGRNFAFQFENESCDDSHLNELLSIDGKVMNIYGCLRYNAVYDCDMLLNPNDNHHYCVNIIGDMLNGQPHDNTVYYLTGIVRLKIFDSRIVFKSKIEEYSQHYIPYVFIEPLSFNTKKEEL